ncbi:Protein kinase-like domain containing protein [Klebsormidium nitens]|uniref:Protein kinase-like domain containing protein n=1 Tax=Klebsormidium nitens TaxID=105231 RepID=A0A1Y1IBM3_KLENI|nr:Protein kinase-like domain containing protein [Klebsormidium nitens]|eukprot:GAQ86127.1 Protein kinase-like domain containing protein [Klebsormidium nitens]
MGSIEAVQFKRAKVKAEVEALSQEIERAKKKLENAENAGNAEAVHRWGTELQQLREKENELRKKENKLLDKEARLESAGPTSGGSNKGSNIDICARLLGKVNQWDEEGALKLSAAEFGEKLLASSGPLPASPQLYDLMKDEDERLGDMLKLEGDCHLVRNISGLLDKAEPTAGKFCAVLVSLYISQGTPVRPDTHLVAEKLSLFFGEDKVEDDELKDVWDDHVRKLKGGLNHVAYGRVPFVPVYAAAGNLLQFGRLCSDGQVGISLKPSGLSFQLMPAGHSIFFTGLNVNPADHQGSRARWSGVRLDSQRDRIAIVTALVNVYKLFAALIKLAPKEHERFSIFESIPRPNGTTILICPATVEKTITNSEAFFESIGNDCETVKAAYELTDGHAHAVSHQSIGNVKGRKRSSTDNPLLTYKVTLSRLGYGIKDVNELSESDLKKAVRAILEVCRLFATAKLGHCDFRISNVLWDPEPFVIDFEAAHKLPWKVPNGFQHFTDWDAGTLSRSGQYTAKSDVYQVGIIMEKYKDLSAEGRRFAATLKSKKVEAEVALKDPYFA